MKKLCFHKPLLISLITAFLLMQWSATHIHLAGGHEHDGGHHQHSVTTHQHQLSNQHTDSIDSATDILSHSDSNKVVEIELVCTQCQANSAEKNSSVQPVRWNIPEQASSPVSLTQTYQTESYQSYYQYSSINLRAPPALS